MQQATKEIQLQEDNFIYFGSEVQNLGTELINESANKNALSSQLTYITETSEVKMHAWSRHEDITSKAHNQQTQKKQKNVICGTLLSIDEYSVFCEFEIDGELKTLELQKALFDDSICIGDLVRLTMSNSDGFLKPIVSVSKPVLNYQTPEYLLADQILESF